MLSMMGCTSRTFACISSAFVLAAEKYSFVSIMAITNKQRITALTLVFRRLISATPMTHSPVRFSDDINDLSPGFVETYTQASAAEAEQLLQICGPGYRKSLEFLVKDYLCHKFPEDAEKIRSELLSQSINRINDHRMKVLAERSTWIGNDETHYVKKREELGLDDMKRFIKAMLSYIESELAFEEAEAIPRK